MPGTELVTYTFVTALVDDGASWESRELYGSGTADTEPEDEDHTEEAENSDDVGVDVELELIV